jgi:multidrug efflux pump subunit AcrB
VNLAKIAIEKKVVTYFATFMMLLAGIASFFALGQLEDPEFTIKTALVATSYPGASADEVELEITDRIELALQELAAVDYIESYSSPGLSEIKVEIKPEYWADRLPQVFDELRRKIRDIETELPPGAGRPSVNDDFGDVFGLVLALTGDGYSYQEMEEAAKGLRKELSLIEGVGRVELWGVQPKVIYLDSSEAQLSQLGLTDTSIISTLKNQNMVVDGGGLNIQNRRTRLTPSGEFRSPEDIADLAVRASLADEISNLMASGSDRSSFRKTDDLIRIRDIGTVSRGYLDPPKTLMRYNGERALGISLSNISGVNVVDVGKAVDARLGDLVENLPIGLELHRVHWMSDIVDTSVKGFFINLAMAVAIVLVVLTFAMGWRMGVIIGTDLIFTILGTLIFLAVLGIDLQRMSLGALVIALGMMVDNSIVVADGFVVRLQQGMDRKQAAIEAAGQPSIPLLGATVIAVMAFYPIFASVESAGEYCRTLFTVVGISLLFSWVVSQTMTPVKCMDMLPDPEKGEEDADPYDSKMFRIFRGLLDKAIRMRVLFMGCMLGLLVLAGGGFVFVEQLFFPDSSMTKIMIDYWGDQGTRIEFVSEDMKIIEEKLMADERVKAVSSFVGAGPPRFYLPVDPEGANPAYGQLVVNTTDSKGIDALIADIKPWLDESFPNALIPIRKYGVGPSNTWKFEVRISGPAIADPQVLRGLAQEGLDILRNEPIAGEMQTDWRQPVAKLVPLYNQERARWAAITREDVANTTKRAYDGRSVGLYREKDDLIPIVLRLSEEDRENVNKLESLQVQGSMSTATIPIAQVTDGVATEWEDFFIGRRDRRRTIIIQANPILGQTNPTLVAAVQSKIEAIELPPGYTMEWGGEKEDSAAAQASLIPGMVPAFAIVLLIIVALFNAIKPPLIILCTIPFALIGITAGLLGFNTPFGFLALLGAMSLAGMMIKNVIVLLDEVNIQLAEGKSQYDAIIVAAMSRLRPVVLAAATTVLGVIPLLTDVFWVGLAVTIMAGLSFGTVLTMLVVPVLYCMFFKIPSPEKGS